MASFKKQLLKRPDLLERMSQILVRLLHLAERDDEKLNQEFFAQKMLDFDVEPKLENEMKEKLLDKFRNLTLEEVRESEEK